VVLNVLYFGCLGWAGYSIYKDIKGEEIGFGFFDVTYFMWPFFLFIYLTGLAVKRLPIDIKRTNPIVLIISKINNSSKKNG